MARGKVWPPKRSDCSSSTRQGKMSEPSDAPLTRRRLCTAHPVWRADHVTTAYPPERERSSPEAAARPGAPHARTIPDQGVRRLAEHDRPVQPADSPELFRLRGPGHSGLSIVAGCFRLRPLSGGSWRRPDPEARTRPHRQRRRLLSGELSVGDSLATDAKHPPRRDADARRFDPSSRRLGRTAGRQSRKNPLATARRLDRVRGAVLSPLCESVERQVR